jgi:PAS domain S-box-containing protein
MGERDTFKEFFNTSRDLFCIVKQNGHIEHINLSVTRMHGYLPRELIDRSFMEFIHPEDVSVTEKAMASLAKGFAVPFENKFRSKDGEYRWMSWSGTQQNNEIYLSGRDITSVVLDQQHLRTAQDRLRLLYEASSNPRHTLWEKIEHVLHLGNKELHMQNGLIGEIKKDILTVMRMKSEENWSFTTGDQVPLEETFSRYALEARKPFAIEVAGNSVYNNHPAHTKVGIESYIGVPLWVRGEVYGTLSFSSKKSRTKAFEITDFDFILLMGQWISSTMALIFAQEDIAYSAAIVESSDDSIIGQSLDGTITAWNKGAQELFGYTDSEIIGQNISVIVPDDLQHEIGETQSRLLKRESVSHFATFRKRKDGSTFDASINMSPIINEEGMIIGISSVIRDITKEKEVDHAKTEFVSLASHQLRTPLSAINWYTELLSDEATGKMNKEQREFLLEIQNAQKRMTSLVGDLLNVSRIELGTFTIEPKNVDIIELVGSVLKEIDHHLNEKKLHIEETYPEEGLTLHVDDNLMRIVFQNLLSNAVKYTQEEGSIGVHIKVEQQKNKVYIDITDTGYGIPKNQQHQIFKKLFRADNAVQKETDGNGLGLYIVKSILEESGGSISFESEENKGTIFHVILPYSGMKKREGNRALGSK